MLRIVDSFSITVQRKMEEEASLRLKLDTLLISYDSHLPTITGLSRSPRSGGLGHDKLMTCVGTQTRECNVSAKRFCHCHGGHNYFCLSSLTILVVDSDFSVGILTPLSLRYAWVSVRNRQTAAQRLPVSE